MARKGKLYIDGLEREYKTLSVKKSAKNVGSWDAALQLDTENKVALNRLVGFEDVDIYRDGTQIFKGDLRNLPKKKSDNLPWMPVGGPEYKKKLKDYLTGHNELTGVSLNSALTTIIENTSYGIGDVASIGGGATAPVYWNTQLEFLDFTFTDTCIVHGATIEATTQPISAGTFTLCKPNLRASFWYYGATKRFYIIAYDGTNLKYNFTANGTTWAGWADFTGVATAASDGASGEYTVYWDGSVLHMAFANSSARVEYWRGSINDGTGAITMAATNADISGAGTSYTNLWAPIVIDSSGHVWIFYVYSVTPAYNARESTDSGASWGASKWNTAAVKCYAFPLTGGDLAVIYYDSANQDVEEWLWDESGGTLAFNYKLDDIDNTSLAFVSGYQSKANSNYWIAYEDKNAGDTADLKVVKVLRENETVAVIHEEIVVADTLYAYGNMCLSGDYADNLYLWWVTDADQHLMLSRRIDGAFEAAALITGGLVDTHNGIVTAPENQYAQFAFWRDVANDLNFGLLAPEGLTPVRTYEYPSYLYEDFEGAAKLTKIETDPLASVVDLKSTVHPVSGLSGLESTIMSGVNPIAIGSASIGNHMAEVYMKCTFRLSQCLAAGTSGWFMAATHNTDGVGTIYVGILESGGKTYFYVLYYNTAGVGAGDTMTECVPGVEYEVEAYLLRHAAAGVAKVWIDGVLESDRTGLASVPAGREVNYAIFGNLYINGAAGLKIWIDDCQASAYRIGPTQTGNVVTDVYTAPVGFQKWGSLTDTEDAHCIYNVDWDVLDGADDSLEIDDKGVPLDMDAEGLTTTITSIKAKPQFTQMGAYYNSIVNTIGVSVYEGSVDVNTDYENCEEAVSKLANMLGMEYKLNSDNTLDMDYELGEDRSAYVVLRTAKSTGYDEFKPCLKSVDVEPDFEDFANHIKVLGAGDYPTRIEASASDTASIATFGYHYDSVTNKDCVTVGMAQTFAQTEVARRKDPKRNIHIEFLDIYDVGMFDVGDYVRVVDDDVGLDEVARVVDITYSWGEGGEAVTADLVNSEKVYDLVKYLNSSKDIKRWI